MVVPLREISVGIPSAVSVLPVRSNSSGDLSGEGRRHKLKDVVRFDLWSADIGDARVGTRRLSAITLNTSHGIR